jgi:hypothetical protein
MSLIELIASAPPAALPLWAVMVFAAGMYPLGIMLGASCSPCCGCPECGPDARLPDTVTVRLTGGMETVANKYGCILRPTANFGEYGEARVTAAPSGVVTAAEIGYGGCGYAKLGRVAPSSIGTAWTYQNVFSGDEVPVNGSGLEVSLTLSQQTDAGGFDYWEATAVSLVSGGSGYQVPSGYTFALRADAPGKTIVPTTVSVTLDGNGTATAVAIDPFFDIAGEHYEESTTATPYVATFSGVTQTGCDVGGGVAVTWSVDDDPTSSTFGELDGITIDSGGSGYGGLLTSEDSSCCDDLHESDDVVLERDDCVYRHVGCDINFESLEYLFSPFGWPIINRGKIAYGDPPTPPVLLLRHVQGTGLPPSLARVACEVAFEATDVLESCDFSTIDLSTRGPCDTARETVDRVADPNGWGFLDTGANELDATATVTANGTYDPEYRSQSPCNPCCMGEGEIPAEVSVLITDNRTDPGVTNRSGTYVLSSFGNGMEWAYEEGGFEVEVFTTPASNAGEGLRLVNNDPFVLCEDDCRCGQRVRINDFGLWNSENYNGNDPGDTQVDPCNDLYDRPMCGPQPKTYNLCRQVDGGVDTDCGDITAEIL